MHSWARRIEQEQTNNNATATHIIKYLNPFTDDCTLIRCYGCAKPGDKLASRVHCGGVSESDFRGRDTSYVARPATAQAVREESDVSAKRSHYWSFAEFFRIASMRFRSVTGGFSSLANRLRMTFVARAASGA